MDRRSADSCGFLRKYPQLFRRPYQISRSKKTGPTRGFRSFSAAFPQEFCNSFNLGTIFCGLFRSFSAALDAADTPATLPSACGKWVYIYINIYTPSAAPHGIIFHRSFQ